MPFVPCCLSTESGTVAVARYRLMLGKRAQSAPTDAPTRSGLIRSPVSRSGHAVGGPGTPSPEYSQFVETLEQAETGIAVTKHNWGAFHVTDLDV